VKLLIVGCGYVGTEVLRQLPADFTAYALTRSEDRVGELEEQGATPIVGDWLQAISRLPQVDLVLVAVPHREVGDLGDETHVQGLENLLGSLDQSWQKLVYLSTTGVFGEAKSEIVDEQTQPTPTRPGPKIAVKAENYLRGKLPNNRCTILRLAGIYGPGRVPLAAKLRNGEPLMVPQDGYLNLVHVHDIAKMILKIFGQDLEHGHYVFSDGKPVKRLEFYEHLAHLCGVAKPEFTQPPEDDSRVRRATSKRVNPSRIIAETAFEFQFPDYRIGLEDAVETQ